MIVWDKVLIVFVIFDCGEFSLICQWVESFLTEDGLRQGLISEGFKSWDGILEVKLFFLFVFFIDFKTDFFMILTFTGNFVWAFGSVVKGRLD